MISEVYLFTSFAIFGGVLIFIWILSVKRIKRMKILQNCGIPGPKPNLFFGNYTTIPEDNVRNDTDLIKGYGPIVGYYVGAKPFILISDIELIKKIQGIDKDKFLARPRKVPGGITADKKRGLMLGNLTVPLWKNLRRIISPTFTKLKLSQSTSQIIPLIRIFINKISLKLSEDIEIYGLFQALVLDTIGSTAFGIDLRVQQDFNSRLLLAIQAEFLQKPNSFLDKFYLCTPELSFIVQPMRLLYNTLWEFSGKSKTSALWEKGYAALELRKKEMKNRKLGENFQRYDLLQHLIDGGSSDTQIVANSVLFFEAAYETLSSSLAFIIFQLVENQDVQDKIRDELLGQNEVPEFETYDSVTDLEYMEAVIYEVLRLLPPQTTFIGRAPKDDYVYKTPAGQEITLPKGVHCQIGLYQVHHSPDYWEDPEEFRPDRFLGPQGHRAAEKSFIYQAFGLGPRECIGKRYALLTMKLILANLLLNFKLIPCGKTTNDLKLRFKVATMTPDQGVYARAIRV